MTTITAALGDITGYHAEAIVNAANASLLGGGGVDGAIHRAAGPQLLQACRSVRAEKHPDGLPTGQAVATPAGDLPARVVIHTVGPDARAGQTQPELLAACFTSSLAEAVRVGARTVAFPAISAGIFGWPMNDVARIAVDAVRSWVASNPDALDTVTFVLVTQGSLDAFRAELE